MNNDRAKSFSIMPRAGSAAAKAESGSGVARTPVVRGGDAARLHEQRSEGETIAPSAGFSMRAGGAGARISMSRQPIASSAAAPAPNRFPTGQTSRRVSLDAHAVERSSVTGQAENVPPASPVIRDSTSSADSPRTTMADRIRTQIRAFFKPDAP